MAKRKAAHSDFEAPAAVVESAPIEEAPVVVADDPDVGIAVAEVSPDVVTVVLPAVVIDDPRDDEAPPYEEPPDPVVDPKTLAAACLANPAAALAVYEAIASGRVTLARWTMQGARHVVRSSLGQELGSVYDVGDRRFGARVGGMEAPKDGTLDEGRAWVGAVLAARGVALL